MVGSGRVISGDRVIDKAELEVRARRAAAALQSSGIDEGDTFAVFLRNDFAFFEARMAAELLGAYIVPINWHQKDEEVGYILRDCEAKALVVHADLLPQIRAGIPDGIDLLVAPTAPDLSDAYGADQSTCVVPDGLTDWGQWIEGFSPWDALERPVRPPILYTSGTTGRPKGVVKQPLKPEQLEIAAQIVAKSSGPRDGMVSLLCGPCYHAPLDVQLRHALSYDADLIIQPRFDAEGFLALTQEYGATNAHMVPVMFVRLLNLPDEVRAAYDVSSIEHIIHGAAPCPVEVKRAMIDWWGPVFMEYYGSTELGVPVLGSTEDWLARPGCAGRLVPGATIKIIGENGEELPPGEVGEIFTGAESRPEFTYKGRDGERAEAELDGMYSMGDLGYIDADGYIFVSDRKRDMVISGGVNIYPAEIEAVLTDLQGVSDCAVFGIPDDEFGEKLIAYVEPANGAQLNGQAVQEHLRAHLANYKVPRIIEFSKNLPRTPTGKILKRELRDPYWKEAGRSI
ncbi:MAG: AMP-binding protein [Rhodospirillales bacterium]|jgi:long-chain acyl-CoA synthetase|nr:long-chain fatty acid--CoA ligase [Rhodospirillaceae bacterium]MDP6427188.1 AMP-binding protein [Rhodospirillales bacterium]MDP6646582.1 AMP-binding protein [Rhodospirillales bacterium]MDP6842997.1 AMP-binding protein [Rhodospirillales bacterium]|tara:strand:- start:3187 stop:4722 length:1536 start_codon:yes stop_codon:yes gene_type:complete